jgi:hypothetical protein
MPEQLHYEVKCKKLRPDFYAQIKFLASIFVGIIASLIYSRKLFSKLIGDTLPK